MITGDYVGGEIRLTYETRRSAMPHVFHLPGFPHHAARLRAPEFDAATDALLVWCQENLPRGSWDTEATGVQILAVRTADTSAAMLMRMRWC